MNNKEKIHHNLVQYDNPYKLRALNINTYHKQRAYILPRRRATVTAHSA